MFIQLSNVIDIVVSPGEEDIARVNPHRRLFIITGVREGQAYKVVIEVNADSEEKLKLR